LVGDGNGKEIVVGIFRGKKRKMERRYEKKKIELKMK